MTITHAYIPTNGITLHVAQAGDENAPLALLLHGFPEYWGLWEAQIAFLVKSGFRVFAPDQRGYNTSDKPRWIADYTLDQLALDIVGLIDAAGREKATIIAHDWGGMVAWWIGVKHGARIEKLAIFNAPHPHVFMQTVRSSPEQQRASRYVDFFQLPWLPEIVLSAFDFYIPAKTMRDSAAHPDTFTDAILGQYKAAWRQPRALRSMINWYRALYQRPSPAPASYRVSVPTMLVWGTLDRWLTQPMAQASVDLCDSGLLHMVEDGTHWIPQEAPEKTNQFLSEFWGV
jgi:pimeloyl-ACP methyl ester carboxylesterase